MRMTIDATEQSLAMPWSGVMMDSEVSGLFETDEDIFACYVTDDALERAAVTDGRIVTIVYCTQDYFSCWPQ